MCSRLNGRFGLVATAVVALSMLGSPRAEADLLSHWPLDGHFDDIGPGENHGLFQGFVEPLFLDGHDGTELGAVFLNGIDEYILVEQNAGLPLYQNPQFTVAMWVQGGPQNDRRIWSESSSGSTSALFNLGTQNAGATGQFDLFIRDAANTAHINHLHSEGIAFDGEWHHVVWVDDNGVGTLYIDGIADGVIFERNYGRPDMSAGTPGVFLDTTTIGGILRATGTCCLFTGAIDDVRIYDHALSATEVAQLFDPDLECPTTGDTHCGSIQVAGPSGNEVGTYVLTATGATDGSGDTISYLFRATHTSGAILEEGPQSSNTATFVLTQGVWNIEVIVDDDPLCLDEAPDSRCSTELTVVAGEPRLVGHWTFDGTLEDASGNDNHGEPFSGFEPVYTEGHDGTSFGAVSFNGIDDLVVVDQQVGLPLYGYEGYTVAMWVRGLPQEDRRVFSHGSKYSNAPLFNIGTDNNLDVATGSVDIYIRNLANQTHVPHLQTQREAFDGEWHHIAWVDTNGQATLYIDGVPDAIDFSYTKTDLPFDTTTIGGILRAAPSHWFTGEIDDVRVYNYALSAQEVAELSGPLECPDEGDTHCDDILVEGPIDDAPGIWTFTSLDSIDESGDEIWYTWKAKRDNGTEIVRGPFRNDPILMIGLASGTWTVEVFVDDDLACDDESQDARCSVEVEVAPVPDGDLLSHWLLDGNVEDAVSDNDGITQGAPVVVEGFDGTQGGAYSFDGADDIVQFLHNDSLPLFNHPTFSIAMWVKGLPQVDRRVWSEGSALSDTPLFNIGTDRAGVYGGVDVYIRGPNGEAMPHRLSEGIAFDGEWHHIAWVDESGVAALYIDGVRDPVDFSYNRPELVLDTTTIGGILRAGPCCWFQGSIDDVRVYTRALTEDEIETLAGIGGGEGPRFIRGDADSSGGLNLTDGIAILSYLFSGTTQPICLDALDADDSQSLNLTDGIYVLNYLFTATGIAPPPPFPECGTDPTEDTVTCLATQPTCL